MNKQPYTLIDIERVQLGGQPLNWIIVITYAKGHTESGSFI